MVKAYVAELCWLVVEKRLFFGMSYERIARELHLKGGKGVACRIMQRFWECGDAAPRQGLRVAPPANALLSVAQRDALMEMIAEADDDRMLRELAQDFYDLHGIALTVKDKRTSASAGRAAAPQ